MPSSLLARALSASALVLIPVLALGACSSAPTADPGSAGAASSTAAEDDALAALRESGVLKIGTEGTYAPFTYHDPVTNELTGYDVEVTSALADKLGVAPEFAEAKWDAIFAGLEAGRYDLIANQVSVNDERLARYDLSDTYATSIPVGVVAEDNTSIASVDDIAGLRGAHSATSNWAQISKGAGARIEPVDGFTEAITAIRDGRVDYTINDNLAVLDYLKSTGDAGVKIAFELPERAVAQAFALRKDSGLLDAINRALDELRAEGALAKISEKYFGEDVSVPLTDSARSAK
ncbi:transporter substrate-binding domain-containing protein [Schaalia hyovaginalis]|uniref:ABC-type amino acid transport substrate-binding protein n=1 Tax=Schaalia hyovaginalis TaxID=29316 RepID=A0A923IW75_9ACTO|nr:transporter substrate-binding domain-containing protein [Schaalia hyovaginalis]MBB6333877.1 ABC-type amino acid transport substrate-binding protein [Schaalia hyovaginalis]MDY2668418.1 transporter substrate-binding domain-containing protein [Schaalia hyovaginalis]